MMLQISQFLTLRYLACYHIVDVMVLSLNILNWSEVFFSFMSFMSRFTNKRSSNSYNVIFPLYLLSFVDYLWRM